MTDILLDNSNEQRVYLATILYIKLKSQFNKQSAEKGTRSHHLNKFKNDERRPWPYTAHRGMQLPRLSTISLATQQPH